MSGGYFDYIQHRFENEYVIPFENFLIDLEAKKRKELPGTDNYEDKDLWLAHEINDETFAEFRRGLAAMKAAVAYAQRIDWFLSGDDDEESFHRRLAKDLEKASITCEDISDKFEPNPNQDTKVFKYQNKYTVATVGVGYDKEGYIEWTTLYSIFTKPKHRRKGHASLMLDYIKNIDGYYCLKSSVTLNDAATNLMKKLNIEIITLE